MSEMTDNDVKLLKPYGLEAEETLIYLYLLENSELSALKISRGVKMPRTKVYRLLDKLIEKRLVVQELESTGFKFRGSDPSELGRMVSRKENEIVDLREMLPEVIKRLESKLGVSRGGSKIKYYRGTKGLSQVNWNLLEAKGEILSFEVATADAYMPQAEAEKLRRALVEGKILTRTITNKEKIEPFTKVTELVEKWWEIRNVTTEVLDIKADTFIYNDIFAVCNYLENGNVFCFELENKLVAQMQRQMFEVMWKTARKMRLIGNEGRADIRFNNT
ncbi:MAG: helix-turn-helix domain-containing protein [Candidatus Shapirobacteria bacterium]|jgi:sugar-specific transcriptional regulator TrmB